MAAPLEAAPDTDFAGFGGVSLPAAPSGRDALPALAPALPVVCGLAEPPGLVGAVAFEGDAFNPVGADAGEDAFTAVGAVIGVAIMAIVFMPPPYPMLMLV